MIHDIVLIVTTVGLFVMTLLWADARFKLHGAGIRRSTPIRPSTIGKQVKIDGTPFRVMSVSNQEGDITMTLLDEASVKRRYWVHS